MFASLQNDFHTIIPSNLWYHRSPVAWTVIVWWLMYVDIAVHFIVRVLNRRPKIIDSLIEKRSTLVSMLTIFLSMQYMLRLIRVIIALISSTEWKYKNKKTIRYDCDWTKYFDFIMWSSSINFLNLEWILNKCTKTYREIVYRNAHMRKCLQLTNCTWRFLYQMRSVERMRCEITVCEQRGERKKENTKFIIIQTTATAK